MSCNSPMCGWRIGWGAHMKSKILFRFQTNSVGGLGGRAVGVLRLFSSFFGGKGEGYFFRFHLRVFCKGEKSFWGTKGERGGNFSQSMRGVVFSGPKRAGSVCR